MSLNICSRMEGNRCIRENLHQDVGPGAPPQRLLPPTRPITIAQTVQPKCFHHTAIMKDCLDLSVFFEFGVLDGRNVKSLRNCLSSFSRNGGGGSAKCKGSECEDGCPLHFEMMRLRIWNSGLGVVVSLKCEVILDDGSWMTGREVRTWFRTRLIVPEPNAA